MRADHLRDLLAALPAETVVLVGAGHIEVIHREAGTLRWPVRKPKGEQPTCESCGGELEPEYELVDVPPHITLGATTFPVPQTKPDPPVKFSGRWNKAAREVIDRYSDDPDAAVSGISERGDES